MINDKGVELSHETNNRILIQCNEYLNNLMMMLIKYGILINGGAMISLLTLVGNDKISLVSIAIVLGGYSLGLILSFVAAILTFFAQDHYSNALWKLQEYYESLITNRENEDKKAKFSNYTHTEDYKKGDKFWHSSIFSIIASGCLFIIASITLAFNLN